jgi:D-glycero-D-manno-heptose 1,7-bisphosphate phosphatase
MPERSPLKLVILDRDGTINEGRDDYVKTVEEWQPIPGSLEAIARLHQGGWHVVIATNQSGLGRGLFDMSTLNAMHLVMNEQLARVGGRIDALFFCPHAPEDLCDCRKPQPGLFTQIGERYGIDLDGVPTASNTLRHLQAGVAAGCAPHLVRNDHAAQLDDAEVAQLCEQIPGLTVHADLAAFVNTLLAAEQRRGAQQARQDARR